VDDSLEPEPHTPAEPAPINRSAATPRTARFVRFAGLADALAMTALRCGTKPVAKCAHGSTSKHHWHRGITRNDGQNCPDHNANNCNADMDGVLGICHTDRLLPALMNFPFSKATELV